MEDDQHTSTAIEAPESPATALKPHKGLSLAYTLKNPAKAAQVEEAKQMIAERTSYSQIARETGLSRDMVSSIHRIYAEEIGTTFKEPASHRAGNLFHMSIDALEQSLEAHADGSGKEIPAGTLSLIACQLADKKLVLEGDASHISEVKHTKHDFIPVEDIYKELQAKKAKAQAINVTPTKDT